TLATGEQGRWAQRVAFSHEGSLAAGGMTDGTVRVWDVQGGAVVKEFRAHRYGLTSVAFSPREDRLATGCEVTTLAEPPTSDLGNPGHVYENDAGLVRDIGGCGCGTPTPG